jgi:hypothetical protein
MALNTNFNVDPYYDDFDDNKDFHRILYKPGYAVQSRELTQSQTILQDQIKKFGDHVFKSGSIVTGGQIFVQNTAYLNLSSTYSGNDITAANFDQEYITNTSGTKKAYVLKAYSADTAATEPITLIINKMYGGDFTADETIITANTSANAINYYAKTALTNATGNSKAFSINTGVFYYEGFFVKNQPQSVAISKYDRNSTALVGFQVTEDVVDYTQDTSLLDPAQSASNFQAPGADRYKITLTLTTRATNSTDLSQFIQLSEFKSGIQKSVIQTPIYGPLGDELARRTYDESGDYIVKSFDIAMSDNASNTAYANVTLSPGKAYVKGYEFGTIAPTTIVIPKPRTVTNVNNQRISADYGYYFYANGFFGNFATNQYSNVDIYCVDAAGLVGYSANTSYLGNLKIGTAKVKVVNFDSSANQLDSNTYIYKMFVTDVNTRSLISVDPNGSANGFYINTSGNNSTFTLPTGFSSNSDCYVGARIRMVGGNGSLDTARTIKYYDGSTRSLTVDRPFSQPIGTNSAAFISAVGVNYTTNSRFVIDFDIGQAESFAVTTGAGSRVASANVHPYSKRQVTTAGGVLHYPVFISDATSEPLLFKVGEDGVAPNTLADFSYSYSRLYQSVSFDSNGLSTALPIGVGETIQAASTTSALQQYYTIVSTAKGSSIYDVGTIVPATGIASVSTSTRKIDLGSNGNGLTANIYATINSSNPTSKTKTFIKANKTLIDPAGGGTTNIFGAGNTSVYVAASDGQTAITSNTVLVRTPGVPQSLFVSDVHSIDAIFDFQGLTISTANYDSIKNNPSYNVTSRYVLTTGQKDSYYDWASIRLKAGQTPPTGPLLVRYNRFKSSGSGYFDVDSYTRLGPDNFSYSDIPAYATEDGVLYPLGDHLDFRPVRKDAADIYTANNFVLDVEDTGGATGGAGPKIPQVGSSILTDYSYYLPRIDRVVLNKIGTFEVIKGVPSKFPSAPVEPDEAMTLYVLSYPAYLNYASSTSIQTFKNKRYTMRDIGALEKRIENLEYYTSLSLLEQSTVSKQDLSILDSTGLPRYKNGIMVDSFVDKTVANFNARDFSSSIDIVNNLARNTFNLTSAKIFSNNSILNSGVEFNGPLLTLSSTTETFLTQNLASKSVNVNPFNVINYVGSVKIDPASDVWTSSTRVEAQNIDLTGGDAARDAWSSIQSTTWGSWQTTWTGVDSRAISAAKSTTTTSGVTAAERSATGKKKKDTTTTTQDFLETKTTNETRTGILSQIVPQQLTKSLGDRVIDVTIVQFMRSINILTIGTGFKPSTTLYTFFDNTNVDKYVYRANIFKFANNVLDYQTTISDPEDVAFYDAGTGSLMGSGTVVLSANNHAFFTNITPRSLYGSWSAATSGIRVVGGTTSESNITADVEHYSGQAISATSSTIVLDYHAGGAVNATNSEYTGQTIRIIGGTGSGTSAVISGYVPATRTVSITGTWTTTPDATSTYSIGTLTSSIEGATAGIFAAPTDTFRTGEKLLRLIDDSTGTVERSTTNGDAAFFSQGLIQTKQETSVSVFVPGVVRSEVTESRTTTSSSIKTATSTKVKYFDPLAETFLVNSDQYPQGLMLSGVRVCFKTKDVTAPVQLQIRPVVNGYPSSSTVYPYADVSLTPDKVKTSTIPNIDDSNKYTEFRFDVPVLLLPGEHSIVLLSNSIGYEAFVAEKDQINLSSSAKISKQAYTGSFFQSQNGSTWSAEQNIDLMFSLQKKVYTNNYGYAYFETDMTGRTANAVYDLMQVMSTDVVLSNTTIDYNFTSQQDGTGTTHAFLPLVPNIDYKMVDGYGRRVLTTTAGNNTFLLRTTLQSSNPDISPMIDVTRLNLLAIENKINNLGLSNTDIVVANVGQNMQDGIYSLSISGGGGSGAAASANVVGGKLSRAWVTTSGSGYTTSPTINLFASLCTSVSGGTPYSGGLTVGTSANGASIVINGEDKKEGGPSKVRYLTRKVQLAPGFVSGDLRVYLLAYKPPLSNIYVYAKYLSPGDFEPFEDKFWNLLTQINNTNFVSADENDYRELTFAPGANNVTTNQITYTNAAGNQTYTDFATFAVKVVMTGDSTVDVPKMKDLRIIALPDGL